MKAFVVCCILIALVLPTHIYASGFNDSTELRDENPYIISFKNKNALSIVKENKGHIEKELRNLPIVVAELSEEAANRLSKHPDVRSIEKDSMIRILGQSVPWGVSATNTPAVHLKGINGAGIRIAILDTGIDYNHEDLSIDGGVSFIPETDFMDDNGHGTHVAGIIGALDNDIGVVGTAPGADIYAVKIMDQYGKGTISTLIEGIDWAISNDMNVINMSVGGDFSSKALQSMITLAASRGIVMVASAGDEGYNRKGSVTYPAKYQEVISVGSLQSSLQRDISSSVGKELDLMAPGVGIYSTWTGNNYVNLTGSSMAAPYVSGISALLLQANSDLTNTQLTQILFESCTPLGDPFYYGHGLVNADKAVERVNNLSALER